MYAPKHVFCPIKRVDLEIWVVKTRRRVYLGNTVTVGDKILQRNYYYYYIELGRNPSRGLHEQ